MMALLESRVKYKIDGRYHVLIINVTELTFETDEKNKIN